MYYQEKTLRRLLICRREYFTSAMQKYLNNPGEYFDKTMDRFLKKAPGESTTVGIMTVDDKIFVIKRYNAKGFWHGCKRMLRQSRALRSWKNSHYLEQHDISIPKPVAVLIERFGPIRGTTYFIMEYVDGLRGWDIFKKDSDYRNSWKKILENVSDLLKKLHAARVSHDDFQTSNMIFVENAPVLLDLDHMRLHLYNSFWFRNNFRKDVKNFIRVLDEINPEASRMAKIIFEEGNKV
jgi:tRNA A-37 threonylcarbamoyl transferase component Bud32